MLSSLFGSLTRNKQHREHRSPFSSPYASIASPIGTRGSPTHERRRIAAGYRDQDQNDGDDASEHDRLLDEEEVEEDNISEEDDEDAEGDDEIADHDEDGDGAHTPLLPIFSAAHLGR